MDNTIIGDVTLDSTLLEESVLCNVSCVSSVLEEELDTCDFTLDSDGSSVCNVILDTRCDLDSTPTIQNYKELPLYHSTPSKRTHSIDSGETLHDCFTTPCNVGGKSEKALHKLTYMFILLPQLFTVRLQYPLLLLLSKVHHLLHVSPWHNQTATSHQSLRLRTFHQSTKVGQIALILAE